MVRAVHDLGIFFLYEANDITLDTDIRELGLSYRSFNILHRNCKTKETFRACGIDNTIKVRHVLNYEIKQILNFRSSGKVSSEEIVTKIHSLGYLFNGEVGYLEQFNNNEVVTENDLKNLDELYDEFSYIKGKVKKKEDLLSELKKLERKREALLIDEAKLDKELVNIINRLSKVNGDKYDKGRK